MRIKRFVAANLGHHEALDFEFHPGCIGVMGPNGSGKSTGLVLSPYSTLTNDWRWDDREKKQCIRQGSAGPAFGKLLLEHNGHEIELYRGLRGPRSHLKLDGAEPVLGDEAIDRELFRLLGAPKKVLGRFLFIHQFMIKQWLTDKASERQESMEYLFGIERVAQLWKLLGEQQSKHQWTSTQELEDVDGLSRDVKALERLSVQLGEKRDAFTILSDEEVDRHRRIVAQRQRYVEVWNDHKRLKESIPESQKNRDQAVEACRKVVAAMQAAEQEFSKVSALARKVEAAVRLQESYDRAFQERQRLLVERDRRAEALQDLSGSLQPIEETPEDHQEILRKLADSQAEVRRLRIILKNIDSGKAVCTECGEPLTKAVAKKSTYLKRLAEVEKTEKKLLAESETLRTRLQEQEKKAAAFDKAKSLLDAAERMLTGHVLPPKPPVVSAKDREVVAKLKSCEAEFSQIRDVQAEKSKAVAVYERELAILQTQSSQKSEELQKLKIDKASADKSAAALSKNQEAREARLTVEGELKAVQAQLREKKARFDDLLRRRRQLSRSHAWLELIGRARARVHREDIAREVGNDYLACMEGEVNELLDAFGAPFLVEASQDLSFNFSKPDGTTGPASWLSGGEKVLLSLCFWLVVHETFASNLGVMVLDEPTDALDSRNIDFLREALEGLRSLVAERRLQLVIVTHHEQLSPVFDQVIRLEAV